jgi:SAM-dependent methyltransferase
MIDYARISRMMDFQKKSFWPLNEFSKDGKTLFKSKIKDIARIILNKGPLKSVHCNSVQNYPLEVFRMGTRGWEYPWVSNILLSSVKTGSKVLDVGCGINGYPHQLLKLNFKSYGLDFFVGKEHKRQGYGLPDEYINKNKGKITFINGGMEKIPLETNTFDAVTCISVMEHVIIENKENPKHHFAGLLEMCRILNPGGIMICTYDTILNPGCMYANKYGWDEKGWSFRADIEFLLNNGMVKLIETPIPTVEEIITDDDTFFIPPDFYFAYGYGSGFENYEKYHKLTSVGFALKKI